MIRVTGNARVDDATAEIAVALRGASPGAAEQAYYDEAMRLRDEILTGGKADYSSEQEMYTARIAELHRVIGQERRES